MAQIVYLSGESFEILKIGGALTFEDKDHLQRAIESLRPDRTVVLDLRKLDYLDSSNLAHLLRLSMQDREVRVSEVREEIAKLFRISGITEVFQTISQNDLESILP